MLEFPTTSYFALAVVLGCLRHAYTFTSAYFFLERGEADGLRLEE